MDLCVSTRVGQEQRIDSFRRCLENLAAAYYSVLVLEGTIFIYF